MLSTQEAAGPPFLCVSARPTPRAWSIKWAGALLSPQPPHCYQAPRQKPMGPPACSAGSCMGSGESGISPWGSQQNIAEHSPEHLVLPVPVKWRGTHRELRKTAQKPRAQVGGMGPVCQFLSVGWGLSTDAVCLTPEASSASPGVLPDSDSAAGAGLNFCVSNWLPAVHLWTGGSQTWLHTEITLEILKTTTASIPSLEGLSTGSSHGWRWPRGRRLLGALRASPQLPCRLPMRPSHPRWAEPCPLGACRGLSAPALRGGWGRWGCSARIFPFLLGQVWSGEAYLGPRS